MNLENFHLQVGDKVQHIRDPYWVGRITEIDENLIEGYGVTTCRVHWEGYPEGSSDIQWTNKLVRVE